MGKGEKIWLLFVGGDTWTVTVMMQYGLSANNLLESKFHVEQPMCKNFETAKRTPWPLSQPGTNLISPLGNCLSQFSLFVWV